MKAKTAAAADAQAAAEKGVELANLDKARWAGAAQEKSNDDEDGEKNDEICIKNQELFIKNEELCIKNEESFFFFKR